MSLCPFVCSFLSVSAVGVDDRSLFVSSGSCSCSSFFLPIVGCFVWLSEALSFPRLPDLQ